MWKIFEKDESNKEVIVDQVIFCERIFKKEMNNIFENIRFDC